MIKKFITFILIITLFFTLPVSTSAQANFIDVPYLDWSLGFISDLVESEIKKAFMLREYARTSSREYFADYFEYWIVNHEDVEMMNKIKNFTPMTYALFDSLEKHGWELD